jgi:glycosyltransferase involved in cell wall biosynthesis
MSIKKFNPHIVLIPISQSTVGFIKDSIFIWISKGKAKTLIMLHGSKLLNWHKASSFLVKWYFSETLKNTKGAIVLGYKLKHIFRNWFPETRIFVVPNGLAINSHVHGFESGSHSDIIIRYIGSLMRSKGIVELIEAIKILKNSHSKFRVILNGVWRDVQLKSEQERTISDYSLPVEYHGEITGEKKYGAYSESDIFVFVPNRPEGHPMVIIEAMAAGLPIISTDQGAITESVIDGVNGFIVKPDSPEEIADKIRFLIDNPKERIQMGKESRRLYEEKFTEDKMVENLKRVFETVLNG